jgi:hypothetical protein
MERLLFYSFLINMYNEVCEVVASFNQMIKYMEISRILG